MASVSILTEGIYYYIEYSIRDGEIRKFWEKNHNETNYKPIIENYDEKLLKVAKDIMAEQADDDHGYSSFIYRLMREGKLFEESIQCQKEKKDTVSMQ
jgi:hypothetical protein